MTERLTKETATDLAQRIINTMRPTPALAEWVEELTDLNAERAHKVFRCLRSETTEGCSIGRFMTAYREDIKTERAERWTPPAHCQLCNGTGWVEATRAEAHNPRVCNAPAGEMGCACHAVKPCRCTNAAQAHRIVDLIETERSKYP